MKNLLLILLATLFVACNEGTRYDEPDMPVTLVETTVDVLPDNEYWKPRCGWGDYKFTILKNQTLDKIDVDGANYTTLPPSVVSDKEVFVDEIRIYFSSDYSADQNKYIGRDKAIEWGINSKGLLYVETYSSGTFDILIIWIEADKVK